MAGVVIITARSELSYLKTGSARITRTCLNNPPPQTIKTPVIRKEVTLTAQKVNMVVQPDFRMDPIYSFLNGRMRYIRFPFACGVQPTIPPWISTTVFTK